jgi:uncharacterized repeat protein (TIGR01451 family)
VPYTRIMAAFMLATLISTLFALPAQAAVTAITNVSSVGAGPLLPGAAFTYTVVVTNDGVADTTVAVTDTLANATVVGVPSYVLSITAPGVPVPCTGSGPYTCAAPNMAASETMTITFNVTAGVAGTATNDASVVSTGHPGVLNATQASTTVQNADLVVTKAHAGATTPGGALTYTITVHNNGPSDATNVTLNDTAPANVTFGTVAVASVPTGITTCAPAPTTTTIACAGWNIPSGMTVTVTVPATLSAATPVGSTISNTASTTTATLDATSANNTATDAFVVGANSVDLGVSLIVAPTTAAPGDTVTYTVTVTNPDTATDATNVVVSDSLPAGLTPVTPPTTPAAGAAAVVGNTWTWTIPTVAKATSATTPTVVSASFDAVVDPTTVLTTITNTVSMTATETDPDSTNNTASADLTIAASVADLNVLTAVDNAKPNQGDTIQIAIQVSNAGPADATNIVVKDVLPTGLEYVSCTPCSKHKSGKRLQSSQLFSMASIPSGSAGTVVLTLTVQASKGTLKNTATVVSADQSDPTGANNSDVLSITVGGTSGNPGGPTGSTGGTGGTGGTSGGTGGTTAFTGFTAGQLMPWFMLLFSLGLVAIEWARRMRLVSPIGSTYGFDPFQS